MVTATFPRRLAMPIRPPPLVLRLRESSWKPKTSPIRSTPTPTPTDLSHRVSPLTNRRGLLTTRLRDLLTIRVLLTTRPLRVLLTTQDRRITTRLTSPRALATATRRPVLPTTAPRAICILTTRLQDHPTIRHLALRITHRLTGPRVLPITLLRGLGLLITHLAAHRIHRRARRITCRLITRPTAHPVIRLRIDITSHRMVRACLVTSRRVGPFIITPPVLPITNRLFLLTTLLPTTRRVQL